MSPLIAAIYLTLVVLLALALATKAEHRVLVAFLLLWLLTYPILVQEKFTPHIPGLDFDLQPTRIVWLTLLPAMVLRRVGPETGRKRSFAPLTLCEKFLIAYVVISIVSMALNYRSLGIRPVISGAEKQLAFGVLYFAARDYLTRNDYRVLQRGILLLAVFSAVVGILQYVYDPQFFRVTGSFRGAFGNVGRSTGVFGQEYEHAMYLTFATIVVGLWGRGRPLWEWICLTALFGISVVVTFQRMPWAVFLFSMLGVLVIRWWNIPRWRDLGVVVAGIVLVCMIWAPWSEFIPQYLPQGLVRGRLMADTLSVRLGFNALAVSIIPKYPLGLGETVASPIYTREFYKFGLAFGPDGMAYTVHNGFLSATVRFGVAGGLAFVCMLFGFFLASARRAASTNVETFVLPLIVAVLICYNVTEDFSTAAAQTVLIAGCLLGSFVGQKLYCPSSDDRNPVTSSYWRRREASERVLADSWRRFTGA